MAPPITYCGKKGTIRTQGEDVKVEAIKKLLEDEIMAQQTDSEITQEERDTMQWIETHFDGQAHTESKNAKEVLNKTKQSITAVVDRYTETLMRLPNLMQGEREGDVHTDENKMQEIDDEEDLERGQTRRG